MKEIDPIVGIDHIAGIDCEITMVEMEMTTEKKIIDHEIIMKEIDPIAETDHIVETDQGITTKEIDQNISTEITKEIGHTVEIGCKATTTKITIEMSKEMNIRRKIIGISRTRDMKEGSRDYYGDAYEDRYRRDKDRNKYRDRYRDDSYAKT